MSQNWKVGEIRQSMISDWKKLIIDFRDQFPYDPLTALIVETFANSIDAKATEIRICIEKDKFIVIDNGCGMNEFQFSQYHNIASLTKTKGEGIGFAGVGAKTYLDRAEYIITETKSEKFKGASFWQFIEKIPEWKIIETSNKLKSNGTYVEVKIKHPEDKKNFNQEFVENALLDNYNTILLGHYNVKKVYVNDKLIEGWAPKKEDIESTKKITTKIGNNYPILYVYKTKDKLPEKYQGISVVVHGKTVLTNFWFNLYPSCGECITGICKSDYLIGVLRTSKSDFDKTSMLWKHYHNKVGGIFGKWLQEVGAIQKPKTTVDDIDKLYKDVESTINDVLKMPEFNDITDKLFQNLISKQTSIKSNEGGSLGNIATGGQTTRGTIGGSHHGGGIITIGDDEEKEGIVENKDDGDTPIERIRRTVKGGISISYDDRPDNLSEGWVDPLSKSITINVAHPTWKIADGLSKESRAEHVRVYHLVTTVFGIVANEVDEQNSKRLTSDLLTKWHQIRLRGQTA
ncbi:MAG: ATP-binding protein [Candidatus Methanofastidiosum sp.]|nr:ATP-binding protein [Methanofastidiosum sp.]